MLRGALCFLKLVFLFSLGKYPEVELLAHMMVPFLIFGGTSIVFSIVAAASYLPTNTAQGFSLLHSHQHLSLSLLCFSLIFLRISCTYGHMKYP